MGARAWSIVLLAVVTGAASPVSSQPPREAEDILSPRIVVVATVDAPEAGRREAYRAAKLLGSTLAADTLEAVPLRRHYVGSVVTLHRSVRGKIVVATWLGDARDAKAPLAEARKHFSGAALVPAVLPPDASDRWIDQPSVRAGILVVGSHRSYHAAVRAARAFGKASGIPYDANGMIFDRKRGLILPDDSEDEVLAGQYVPRRYDATCNHKPCVTVERSETYQGFRPGLYIVVAGILDGDPNAQERLATARRIVPTAYIKDTTLYMGCIH